MKKILTLTLFLIAISISNNLKSQSSSFFACDSSLFKLYPDTNQIKNKLLSDINRRLFGTELTTGNVFSFQVRPSSLEIKNLGFPLELVVSVQTKTQILSPMHSSAWGYKVAVRGKKLVNSYLDNRTLKFSIGCLGKESALMIVPVFSHACP